MNTSTLDSRTYTMAFLLNELISSSRNALSTIFDTVDIVSEKDFLEVCNLSHQGIEAHKEAEHSWYLDFLIEERDYFLQNRELPDDQAKSFVFLSDNGIVSAELPY